MTLPLTCSAESGIEEVGEGGMQGDKERNKEEEERQRGEISRGLLLL